MTLGEDVNRTIDQVIEILAGEVLEGAVVVVGICQDGRLDLISCADPDQVVHHDEWCRLLDR